MDNAATITQDGVALVSPSKQLGVHCAAEKRRHIVADL